MGAWGLQPFEDDIAFDWTYELLESKDKAAFLLRSLTSPSEDTSGTDVFAAAEVVAALLGKPCPQLATPDAYTKDTAAWLKTAKIQVSPQLQSAAQRAVKKILDPNSELAGLWADSFESDDNEWRRQTEDALKRLGG